MAEEQQRQHDMTGRQPELVSAQQMIVQPRRGITGLNLAQPARAHAHGAGKLFLGYASPAPGKLDASPRKLFDERKQGIVVRDRSACLRHRDISHERSADTSIRPCANIYVVATNIAQRQLSPIRRHHDAITILNERRRTKTVQIQRCLAR